jgi:hypothetical protein
MEPLRNGYTVVTMERRRLRKEREMAMDFIMEFLASADERSEKNK